MLYAALLVWRRYLVYLGRYSRFSSTFLQTSAPPAGPGVTLGKNLNVPPDRPRRELQIGVLHSAIRRTARPAGGAEVCIFGRLGEPRPAPGATGERGWEFGRAAGVLTRGDTSP